MYKRPHRLTYILGFSVIILIVFGSFELLAYAAYKMVVLPRAPFLVYLPPETGQRPTYEKYQTGRDPVVGWPLLENRYRSRPTPAISDSGEDCVSVYGDSFAYASEVTDSNAWTNVISETLGCRVANYGVPGYGTDQAYLRFSMNAKDLSPVTILGIFPHNIMRNVNQYRWFITGGDPLGFKPRFILSGDELVLVPPPTVNFDELPSFYDQPGKYLEHESFLPNTYYGQTHLSFPYSIALARLSLKERTINWVRDRPSWGAFAQPLHRTQSMEITSAIVSKFNDDCIGRDKKCLAVIIPSASSYDWFQKRHALVTQSLLGDILAKGIEAIDVTEALAGRLVDDSFCTILSRPTECCCHFNARGNNLFAQVVLEHLVELAWVAMPQTPVHRADSHQVEDRVER